MRKKLYALTVTALILFAPLFSSCGKATGPQYTIYLDSAAVPYGFFDRESLDYIGVDTEILSAVAEDQQISFTVLYAEPDDAGSAVLRGRADAMLIGTPSGGDLNKSFDFSDGCFYSGQQLAARRDSLIAEPEELKDKTVACVDSSVAAKYAEENKNKYAYVIDYYENFSLVLEAVFNGEADACIGEAAAIYYAAYSSSPDLTAIGGIFAPVPYRFAVKKGTNKALLAILSKGLADISTSGRLDLILEKYGLEALPK